MADDIITFGGPGRDRERGRGDTFESLFRAHFAGVAAIAYSRVGDWAQAERLAQQAYLRLWRRWSLRRWVTGLGPDALPFLERTVAALAAASASGRVGQSGAHDSSAARREPDRDADRDSGQDPDQDPETAAPVIDVDRAWHEFLTLRSRAVTTGRRALVAGCLLAVFAAAGVAGVLAGTHSAVRDGRSGPGNREPARPPLFPGAVVATIPVTGVISVTADATQAWAIRAIGLPFDGISKYQLVGIDLRTDRVARRVSLGRQSGVVAAGGGALWLTTPDGRAGGQLERADPVTGRVLARLHLPAGDCGSLAYGAGYFVATCQNLRSSATEFFRVDAATGRVDWRSGAVTSEVGAVIVTPRAIWYAAGVDQVRGFVIAGGRAVSTPTSGHELSYAGNQSLVYGGGSVWELTDSDSVLRIDPGSGRVTRIYRSGGYNPARVGGSDFLTVGSGSLWLLHDGYPFSRVLEVSRVTGRAVGGVVVPPGSCGQQRCSQIYATPGAIWVLTAEHLIRIDPARMVQSLHPRPGLGAEVVAP